MSSRGLARIAIACAISMAATARAQPMDVRCADASTCSESVAWLVRRSEVEVLRCTAFLVATDTLMTARHCVEPWRRDGGRTLEGRFEAYFPESASRVAERHDARIWRIADETALAIQSANDWAVLRLETHSERRPLRFDRSGFQDASNVALHVVDAIDETHGIVRTLACHTVLDSIFAPHIDEPLAPAVVLAGCDVRAGHSGGPVVDTSGAVRAVVHARDLRTWPWREPLRYPELLAGALEDEPVPIAYATNLACVDWGRPGPTVPSCVLDGWLARTRHPGAASNAFANRVLAEARDRVDAARAELEGTDPARAEWRVAVRERNVVWEVVARPACGRGPSDAPFESRRVAIVVASDGRPAVRVTASRGRARGWCRGPAR